jgi:membrane-anchored protein YejM (alkaline phosphatase superfamily)
MAFVGFGLVNSLFLTRFESLAPVEWMCLALYVVGQALLVVACWNLLLLLVVRLLPSPRWSLVLHGLFASVLVLLVIDYALFTLIELHLIRWVKDVWSAQGFAFLVRTIVWTNMPALLVVGLSLLAFVVAPIVGSVLYLLTLRRSEAISHTRMVVYLTGAVVIGVATLLAEGAISLRTMRPTVFKDKYRILPLPTRVVAAPGEILSVPITVKPLRDPQEVARQLKRIAVPAGRQPNVFVFAIETLRADAITPEVAPNLYRFA